MHTGVKNASAGKVAHALDMPCHTHWDFRSIRVSIGTHGWCMCSIAFDITDSNVVHVMEVVEHGYDWDWVVDTLAAG
jgi:hypothetical protein